MDRRKFLATVGTGTTIGFTGCLGNDEDEDDAPENGADDGDDSDEASVNVGIIYSIRGLGDESFNDMAHAGIQQAADDFDITFQNAQPDTAADMNDMQRTFANDPETDLVICIGFDHQADLIDNAVEFADTNFALIDEEVEEPNVANYLFREQEGSFQVGHLAGLLTTMDYAHAGGSTNTADARVGFVGGQRIPLIERFEAGYMAGALHADDSIETPSAYAEDWNDPATGQEIAIGMYDEGADVVYHAAGGTGRGVFEAASSHDRFAIGVDDDQSISVSEFSEWIVASMIKRVDTAVYESVESVVEGAFEGGTNNLGLEEDGVGAVIGQDFEDEMPDEIVDALEESRQAIIDSDIDVPETVGDV